MWKERGKERGKEGREKSNVEERKGQSVWKEHGRTAVWRMPRQHALQLLGGSDAARAGSRACAERRAARKRQSMPTIVPVTTVPFLREMVTVSPGRRIKKRTSFIAAHALGRKIFF